MPAAALALVIALVPASVIPRNRTLTGDGRPQALAWGRTSPNLKVAGFNLKVGASDDGRTGQARAIAPAERPVPFTTGEELTYDISWSSFLTAGTATVQVREKKPSFDSVAYYVTAEGVATGVVARLYSVYYKADTLLDVFSLLPQRASVFSQERGRQQMKVTRFDQAQHRGTFEVAASHATTVFVVPAAAQDPLSALFVLRTMPLRAGIRIPMVVAFNGVVYRVELSVGGREPVQALEGRRLAWRITPIVLGETSKTAPSAMSVWIGDDAKRLPLRIEVALAVGNFNLVLRSAR